MHYFSNLFWYRVLHVSDRSTVHHQESQHCIHSNKPPHVINHPPFPYIGVFLLFNGMCFISRLKLFFLNLLSHSVLHRLTNNPVSVEKIYVRFRRSFIYGKNGPEQKPRKMRDI